MANRERGLLAFIIILSSWVLLLLSTELTAYGYPQRFSWWYFLLRMVLVVFSICLQIGVLRWVMKTSFTNKMKNRMTTVLAVTLVLTLLEGVFTWIPMSNGSALSLAAINWKYYYWDTNAIGYRVSLPGSYPEEKTKVFVLGDSFVSGQGINDVSQRFSNQLQGHLGADYRVFNLGKNGANTKDEFQNLKEYLFQPDILIWVHTPNDIREESDMQQGRKRLSNLKEASLEKNYLITHSYLLNYCYYKVVGVAGYVYQKWFPDRFEDIMTEKMMDDHNSKQYWKHYLDPERLAVHQQNLKKVVEHCEQNDIQLLVVLFPHPWEVMIDHSQQYVNRPLEAFFTELEVPVSNLYPMMKEIPVKDRIVSYNDTHPGPELNEIVAKIIFEELCDHEYISDCKPEKDMANSNQ